MFSNSKFITFILMEKFKEVGVRKGVTFCGVWKCKVTNFVYILEKHVCENDGIFIMRYKEICSEDIIT